MYSILFSENRKAFLPGTKEKIIELYKSFKNLVDFLC